MDFARKHIHEESTATHSKIRVIPVDEDNDNNDDDMTTRVDNMLVRAANQAARDLIQTSNPNSNLYPERMTPQTDTIQAAQLVVIFESFDNLNFCYVKPGEIFNNKNGHFHHDDFIGKPYGCKVRSRNNQGYGFCYLLKPTPELWARSLNHRTQIVHELDASMIVFFLNLRPNMIVCESGTGSGALSHCILRTIAPRGHLHTYEFNKLRSETARQEFVKNRVDHLVTVHHRDVCGGTNDMTEEGGGFNRPQGSVDAIILDLPQPWLAVPHAAFCSKPNARIASYSPCVEQSQRTVQALEKYGFHTITTKEFRLKEYHIAEEEYELVPKDKRPRFENPHHVNHIAAKSAETTALSGGGEDTGTVEADNEKSEAETEGGTTQYAKKSATTKLEGGEPFTTLTEAVTPAAGNDTKPTVSGASAIATTPGAASTGVASTNSTTPNINSKRVKKVLVARPFSMMRGHTAFLTFATAGNRKHDDPNTLPSSS